VWNRTGSSAIKLSTISVLLVCFVAAVLFASSILYYSTRLIIFGLFIAAMLTSTVGLTFFFAGFTSQLKASRLLYQWGRGKAPDPHMHATEAQKPKWSALFLKDATDKPTVICRRNVTR
jgi:hypothetical protein